MALKVVGPQVEKIELALKAHLRSSAPGDFSADLGLPAVYPSRTAFGL